jgi:hypothetical protein
MELNPMKIVKASLMVSVFILTFCLASHLYADQTYSLRSPDYQIESTADGFDKILAEGYYSYGVPGHPDLPSKIIRWVVPPDVVSGSIKVAYSVKKWKELGTFKVKASPIMAARYGDLKVIGKNADVYLNDLYYPEDAVEVLLPSQMRKWKFISVKYTPFQYNPLTGNLRIISEVDVIITYDRVGRNFVSDTNLADRVMDTRATEVFNNFSESQGWYQPASRLPGASASYNYVIITTNAIEAASTRLGDFVTYLADKQFTPLVVTEDDYGGLTGQTPNGTAEKIRQWLINYYSSYGIEYVLLIGNPDPDDPGATDSVGDVPMKMCWPRRHEGSNEESPTDYFYADLTGNWDLDGDGYFGEYCDVGPVCGSGHGDVGGVDFANEVYVGRIPVYPGGIENLDSVLSKTITYGNETDISWRQRALLPMSFSDASTDGAYLSEAMIGDYLNDAGFSDWTLYLQGSVCSAADSTFGSDQELLTNASWERWRDNDYGMVWWWGHGYATGASLGYSDCGWGQIINSANTTVLDDRHPSHVYQCSCLNGEPEIGSAAPTSCNLGTALLYNGAITTISASRVSWYAVTSWSTGLKYYCDNASIGYYYGQELVTNGKRASMALFDVKADMGANYNGNWDGSHWMNLFDFNLYGDPAMSMTEKGVPGDGLTPNRPASLRWVR